MGIYNLDIVGPGAGLVDKEVVSFSHFVLDRGGDENYMRFSIVSMHLKHLMGEVLTTLEASIADERQLKATKSIVKNYFGRKIDWVYQQCGCPEEEQNSLPDQED